MPENGTKLPNSAATVPLSERLERFVLLAKGFGVLDNNDLNISVSSSGDGLGCSIFPWLMFEECVERLRSAEQSEGPTREQMRHAIIGGLSLSTDENGLNRKSYGEIADAILKELSRSMNENGGTKQANRSYTDEEIAQIVSRFCAGPYGWRWRDDMAAAGSEAIHMMRRALEPENY